jgi:hypothetical protein
MKKTSFLLVAVSLLLAGCSKHLSGRYEAHIARVMPFDSSTFTLPSSVAKTDRATLEFVGAKVKLSNYTGPSDGFPYRFDGRRLVVRATSGGLNTDIPMIVHDDGSIAFGQGRYFKVE